MKYPYIKNIAHEEIVSLASQVETMKGQVVSKTRPRTKLSVSLCSLLTKMKKSAPTIPKATPWSLSWKVPGCLQ